VEKHKTQKIDVVLVKIGGGNTTKVAPDRFSNLFDITTIGTVIAG
jgi:Zn finger protein HypA/HybF involved in hydrogenase expression